MNINGTSLGNVINQAFGGFYSASCTSFFNFFY